MSRAKGTLIMVADGSLGLICPELCDGWKPIGPALERAVVECAYFSARPYNQAASGQAPLSTRPLETTKRMHHEKKAVR